MADQLIRFCLRQDAANRAVWGGGLRVAARRYYRRMVTTLGAVMRGAVPAVAISDVAAEGLANGFPIHGDVLTAGEDVLQVEARYMVLCVSSLSAYHGDARAWLAHRTKRPESSVHGSVPWNLFLGGAVINPSGE